MIGQEDISENTKLTEIRRQSTESPDHQSSLKTKETKKVKVAIGGFAHSWKSSFNQPSNIS